MIENLEFIRADLGHAFDIHELEIGSFDSGAAWSMKMILDSFSNDIFKCYLLRRFNEFIGFVAFFDLGKEYEIVRLVVAKNYRRYGCATSLLRFLNNLASLNETEYIILDVSEFNHAAHALYVRNGYKPDGMRKNYYGKGEHAILMRKEVV